MAKVRKFNLDVPASAAEESGGEPPPETASPSPNTLPDIPEAAVERITANAPVRIRATEAPARPGNPRQRRYQQRTYSLLAEDIERIEALLDAVRGAGLYERGRSDIVRAGVALLESLPLEAQVAAVQAVEHLRGR